MGSSAERRRKLATLDTDTTEMLSQVREQILKWETARPGSREENEAAEAATRLMSELDAALCAGADLPEPWKKARGG